MTSAFHTHTQYIPTLFILYEFFLRCIQLIAIFIYSIYTKIKKEVVMKIFHVCMIIGCGVAMAPLAAMGSKTKPATEVREPKVLPESTPVSAISNSSEPSKAPMPTAQPVKLIENTASVNQKNHDEMTAPVAAAVTKADDKGDASKQTKKSSNKKNGKSKKAASKRNQSKKK